MIKSTGVATRDESEVLSVRDIISSDIKDGEGITIMDFLTWAIIAAAVLGFVMLVAVPKFKAWSTKNTLTSEARTIVEGASAYYEDHYKYPKTSSQIKGSYVDTKVFDKGWQYQCSGSTITLTTPAIADANVRAKIASQFGSSFDSGSVAGNSVRATINDRPCP